MAITGANYILELGVQESLELGLDLVTNPNIFHGVTSTGRLSGTLTPSTSIPVTKVWSDTAQLSGGTATWDFTNLAGPVSSTITFSGLKVQNIMISCPSSNTSAVKFDVGSSNGYNLFGASTSELSVLPGGAVCYLGAEGLPDVAGGAKTVDLSSSDTDATYSVVITAG